ncbi:MAG: HD domain-containing protein [Candidatus Omnitrophica bacterium]|jgi:poly(A) polymerase|nr:HD domain-containing protein [Candidatus Omnitrophota bacterium]
MNYLFKEDSRHLLNEVLSFSREKKVRLYIVGGFLRDYILKRSRVNPDIDFCLKKGSINFGRKLSAKIKAGFVVLDKEHGACRLVKKIKDKIYTLDFTDFRGKTLEEDLLHRDFTINTLALGLEEATGLREKTVLIDLYGAAEDLRKKIIRMVNKEAFDEDPLRILRAFSLSAVLGFKIDSTTLKLIRVKRNKLTAVSCERLREELFKIFDTERSYEHMVMMDKHKVLQVVIPEIELMRGITQGPYHHLDVLKHSFETIRQLENFLAENKFNRDINNYLNEELSSGRRRYALIKLGAFLHDIGKPQAKRRLKGRTMFHGHERIGSAITTVIARRLKLSNVEIDALRKMVFWHLRPGYLADNEEISARANFRYFRDTAKEGVSVLLLSLGDQRATRGRLTSEESRLTHEKVVISLIKEYFRRSKEKKLKRLVTGNDLMRKFKLPPSPLIGRILIHLEELQAIAKINSKQEALKAANIFLKKEG